MSARPQITDRDRGFAAMVARLAKHPSVKVGVLSDEPKEERDGAGEEISLLEVAAIHEFGAPAANIPQRSFIRETVDVKREEIQRLQLVQAQRIVKGDVEPEAAVEQIGARVKGMIQQRIAAGIEPPNAPSTIERKGSSKPLVDTGQLRESIDYQVEREGGR